MRWRNCLLRNHLAEIFSISEIVHDALRGGELEAAQHKDGPVETLHSHDRTLPPPPHSNQWHVLIVTEDQQGRPQQAGRCRWSPPSTWHQLPTTTIMGSHSSLLTPHSSLPSLSPTPQQHWCVLLEADQSQVSVDTIYILSVNTLRCRTIYLPIML